MQATYPDVLRGPKETKKMFQFCISKFSFSQLAQKSMQLVFITYQQKCEISGSLLANLTYIIRKLAN
jgi:hypothetical protein